MRPKGGIHSNLAYCPFKVPESSHRVWSIPPLMLEVGIKNSVCGCILGCKVLCTIFGVTLTLTSCLSYHRINCVPSISQQISYLDAFGVVDCSVLFWVAVTLTSDFGLLKSCAEHIST